MEKPGSTPSSEILREDLIGLFTSIKDTSSTYEGDSIPLRKHVQIVLTALENGDLETLRLYGLRQAEGADPSRAFPYRMNVQSYLDELEDENH